MMPPACACEPLPSNTTGTPSLPGAVSTVPVTGDEMMTVGPVKPAI